MTETHQLQRQLDAVRAIGATIATSVGLDALLESLVPHVTRLMDAERSTLFLYNRDTNEIWSRVAEGDNIAGIRLTVGQGLAGWVAEHRQLLCVDDAYADARFQPATDERTGFRTRAVAAVPLLGHEGQLLGVMQVLNPRAERFNTDDLGLLRAIAAETAFAVENAQLAQQILDRNRELEASRRRSEQQRAELDLLYELEQETSASRDLDQLLNSIIARTCRRLSSEAGSVLLLSADSGELYFRGVAGGPADTLMQQSLAPGRGIAGWVAETGQPLIVNDPETDPRHDRILAEQVSIRARAILAVPLIWDRRVIGAVEVLNPVAQKRSAEYGVEDLKVLTLVAGQLSRAVMLAQQHKERLDTERMAAIGNLLASVAHDLRNPMTVISGYAQLMVGDDRTSERQTRCERILTQVDDMTAMIGDLLAFARGDSKLRPVGTDIGALAQEIQGALRLQCEPRGILLDVQVDGAGTAFVDLGRTKRIVYNLARNAIDVLSRGSKLSIALRKESGVLALTVRDNGPGIPEEIRGRLFEPFVTARKQRGTGLGLSIVKRFVEDHGGQIELDSSSSGTTFSVRLREPPTIDA